MCPFEFSRKEALSAQWLEETRVEECSHAWLFPVDEGRPRLKPQGCHRPRLLPGVARPGFFCLWPGSWPRRREIRCVASWSCLAMSCSPQLWVLCGVRAWVAANPPRGARVEAAVAWLQVGRWPL